MKTTAITSGGQIQVPADVRRRWGTRNVTVEDRGESLVVRPIPDDPIGAAVGSLAGDGPTSHEIREQLRDEELEADRSAS
jgi:bifunctional DNA-binding transcriptional regulator/antitoxin component of YhaV-PrlF toxin-antitoxin module